MDKDTQDTVRRLVNAEVANMKKKGVPLEDAVKLSGASYEDVDRIYRGSDSSKAGEDRVRREAQEVKQREKV